METIKDLLLVIGGIAFLLLSYWPLWVSVAAIVYIFSE